MQYLIVIKRLIFIFIYIIIQIVIITNYKKKGGFMKNIYVSMLMIMLLLILFGGCSQSQSASEKKESVIEQTSNDKIQIYTTIFPLQDFAKKIGGQYVEVENIVPTGTDAHSFEPTMKTMVNIAEGDAFIYLGTGIEGFADAVIDAVKEEDTKILKTSEGINLIKGEGAQGHEEEDEEVHSEEKEVDPHVWLDPRRAIQLAENIKNLLVEIEPDKKEYFEENYNNLKVELENLDLAFRTMVEDSAKRTFIVAHSAYGYWQDAYGLKQIGVSGLSPSDEPSQKDLEKIIKSAEQTEINFILFEQNVENRVAEVIKNEIGAETLTIYNLESISEEDVDNNEDYISIMEKNIETLGHALK